MTGHTAAPSGPPLRGVDRAFEAAGGRGVLRPSPQRQRIAGEVVCGDELVAQIDEDAERFLALATQREPIENSIDAYKAFDKWEPGWIKVKLEP